MEFFLHVFVPILGILISAGTLIVVIIYTAITARIERAAQEQAEASQKPVVVIQFVARGDDLDQSFEKIEMGISPQAMKAKLDNDGKFIIKNIGSGPALNIDFILHLVSEPNPIDPHSHPRKVPYVAPQDTMAGPVTVASLGLNSYKFKATYGSLSGKSYQTEMQISGGTLLGPWIFT
jgi:hypothetical protein